MEENQKQVIVTFDEMALKVYFYYDDATNVEVIGLVDFGDLKKGIPAEEVLVSMVRELYSKWKQPVAFWYTHAGLSIRIIVTDGMTKNWTAMTQLGATVDTPWFYLQGQNIFTGFDVCHIKSLRSAMLW